MKSDVLFHEPRKLYLGLGRKGGGFILETLEKLSTYMYGLRCI